MKKLLLVGASLCGLNSVGRRLNLDYWPKGSPLDGLNSHSRPLNPWVFDWVYLSALCKRNKHTALVDGETKKKQTNKQQLGEISSVTRVGSGLENCKRALLQHYRISLGRKHSQDKSAAAHVQRLCDGNGNSYGNVSV